VEVEDGELRVDRRDAELATKGEEPVLDRQAIDHVHVAPQHPSRSRAVVREDGSSIERGQRGPVAVAGEVGERFRIEVVERRPVAEGHEEMAPTAAERARTDEPEAEAGEQGRRGAGPRRRVVEAADQVAVLGRGARRARRAAAARRRRDSKGTHRTSMARER
jgi:hypothetical protein